MKCVHISLRKAIVILLTFLINNVPRTLMADDNRIGGSLVKEYLLNDTSKNDTKNVHEVHSRDQDTILMCPVDKTCEDLPTPCMKCNLSTNCIYGETVTVLCEPKDMVDCKGNRTLVKQLICRYCYQTEAWEHKCLLRAKCNSVSSPRLYYTTECTVKDDILCLGHRTFFKNVECNWTGGYRWSTALLLSVTLGGFGADRFYLGHWQEGIGKLFSFGGLGVWTIIDVALISLHYLGPADGSLYL